MVCIMKTIAKRWEIVLFWAALMTVGAQAETFQTRYARVGIDEKGFITSITSRQTGKEYSPAGHPSPLISLHEAGQPNDKLVLPVAATFGKGKLELKYVNG